MVDPRNWVAYNNLFDYCNHIKTRPTRHIIITNGNKRLRTNLLTNKREAGVSALLTYVFTYQSNVV